MPIFSCFAYFCVFLHTSLVGKFIEPSCVNAFILDTSTSFHAAHRSVRRPGVEIGYWNLQPAAAAVAALPESIFSLVTFPLDVCITCKLEFPFRKTAYTCHKALKESYWQEENSSKSMLRFYFFRMVYSQVYAIYRLFSIFIYKSHGFIGEEVGN